MPKMSEIMHIMFYKNVRNHAIFVEGFWPEFYARGSFMKYFMSGGEIENTNHIYSCEILNQESMKPCFEEILNEYARKQKNIYKSAVKEIDWFCGYQKLQTGFQYF